ncbi:beta/gamma crystallin domain-containing protein [Streptosporangium sp. NPDC051023]|uniref:beta/gamma crystallin domain-containing protein n=1 Tax=Streptosporangium sp. NPDC051023 TaxID=3155410 RepID=UPI00344FBF96
MRKIIASALSASAIALGMIGMTATPAAAAQAMACDNTSGYLKIHNDISSTHCFAYAGHLDVYITGVRHIESGNNKVKIDYKTCAWCPENVILEKWQSWTPPTLQRVTVEDITIY